MGISCNARDTSISTKQCFMHYTLPSPPSVSRSDTPVGSGLHIHGSTGKRCEPRSYPEYRYVRRGGGVIRVNSLVVLISMVLGGDWYNWYSPPSSPPYPWGSEYSLVTTRSVYHSSDLQGTRSAPVRVPWAGGGGREEGITPVQTHTALD